MELPFFCAQEDVVAEARQVESEASSYLDQISRYYLQRARILSKIAKYPHIVSFFVLHAPALVQLMLKSSCKEH